VIRVVIPALLILLLFLPLLSSFQNDPSILFENVARKAGIAAQMVCGGPEKKWIPEANGSGVAWLDYDNDGWMDLLIVNGSTLDDLRQILAGKAPAARRSGVYLYHNLGNGRFEDVTAKAGLNNPYWGTGANAADFNNDGYVDIFITAIGRDLLYRNNGDGTFTEVGKAAGLSQSIAWHTGSAFGDYDGDGNLDLYVAGYVDLTALNFSSEPPVCDWKGLAVFCGPRGLRGEPDILYRNNGDGTFTDVTKAAGVEDTERYHGFTAVFDDFNGDGKPDIFVANDSDPNYLYLNAGNGTFRESGLMTGIGANADGVFQANMGVAVGDYDNDGRTDLLTTTFEDSYFPLFHQAEPGFFEDVSTRTGLSFTAPLLGWGCGFADLDNDGKPDLWLANGHIYPPISRISVSYFQPILVLRNTGNGFVRSYSFPAEPENSYRGAAAGDFNNDGRVDLAILPISGLPVLLQNRTENQNTWVGFVLKGSHHNREGIGARIRLEACGTVQYQSVRAGGSYLSRDDPRPHFGLDGCKNVTRAVITWPGGKVQVVEKLPVNRYTEVQEPAS